MRKQEIELFAEKRVKELLYKKISKDEGVKHVLENIEKEQEEYRNFIKTIENFYENKLDVFDLVKKEEYLFPNKELEIDHKGLKINIPDRFDRKEDFFELMERDNIEAMFKLMVRNLDFATTPSYSYTRDYNKDEVDLEYFVYNKLDEVEREVKEDYIKSLFNLNKELVGYREYKEFEFKDKIKVHMNNFIYEGYMDTSVTDEALNYFKVLEELFNLLNIENNLYDVLGKEGLEIHKSIIFKKGLETEQYKVRFFKNGNLDIKFKNKEVVEKLNQFFEKEDVLVA